jgi:hypothetical protein
MGWCLPPIPCPLCTHTMHPPHKQLLAAVVWGAGCSWSSSLIPSSLVHQYLSHSTPFHPMSNCSWQQLGMLHRAGFVISPILPFYLSPSRLVISPPLVLYGGGGTPLVSLSSHIVPSLLSLVPAGILLVLAASWCSCRFGSRGHCINSTCNDRIM